jgi:hypothetical protein
VTGGGRALEPRITLITFGVSDLDRSVQFYRDGLGLPRRDGPDGVAFFETRGTWLSLYPRESLAEDATVSAKGSAFRGFALSHNVKSPEEVDRTLQQAVDAGATLVKPIPKASRVLDLGCRTSTRAFRDLRGAEARASRRRLPPHRRLRRAVEHMGGVVARVVLRGEHIRDHIDRAR